ncbi:hypothetical protein Tco_0924830 [Tanacetum coccineum]|uniref:Uncharacterized protein n=1 Tax=Tanacetum coccineum TaxID=301880 RepID=A0ABQ5D859_9ASTR
MRISRTDQALGDVPVHCVPKKGGITLCKMKKCVDIPLMLERLAGESECNTIAFATDSPVLSNSQLTHLIKRRLPFNLPYGDIAYQSHAFLVMPMHGPVQSQNAPKCEGTTSCAQWEKGATLWPRKGIGVRSFLGHADYTRRSIFRFFHKSRPAYDPPLEKLVPRWDTCLLKSCAMHKVILLLGQSLGQLTHRLSTAYHPQTSGQVEAIISGLKRIWNGISGRYIMPLCTGRHVSSDRARSQSFLGPGAYQLDYQNRGDTTEIQLNELNELRDHAYENSLIYKEKSMISRIVKTLKYPHEFHILSFILGIQKRGLGSEALDMAPLPAADQRHPWLRYQIEEYNEEIRHRSGSEVEDGLHTEQEMAEAGFRAYWAGSDRLIPDMGVLRDYWIKIYSDRDFLGPAPFYVLIRDPVRRGYATMMISYSSFSPAAEEVAPEIPAPVQAPPPAPQPRTMSQRIERLEEEVHDLRRDIVGLRGDVVSFTTEQSRVSTWLISCMT